jgi:TolB protein
MDADGTNADLLTTATSSEKPYRLNPSWSPDGRRIAYESQVKGISQLMLISPRDRSVTPLTNEGENEAPSWAPDGRHLVFSSTRGGTQQLWILDVDSGRLRQLTRGPRARRAAWSPRLDVAR